VHRFEHRGDPVGQGGDGYRRGLTATSAGPSLSDGLGMIGRSVPQQGGTVSDVEVEVVPPVRVADWEAFAVPEGYRAEVIQGQLVVTPGTGVDHGRAQSRLTVLLAAAVPPDYEPVSGIEWRLDVSGIVAMAPQPDIMVVPRTARGPAIVQPPLLAVEVLSPSDLTHRLASGMTRRAGKLADYALNGLEDYLEIDLTTSTPVAIRYELRRRTLVEVDRATGPAVLRAERPFPYEVRPLDLIE
jgi:Uma2 family endonuclease